MDVKNLRMVLKRIVQRTPVDLALQGANHVQFLRRHAAARGRSNTPAPLRLHAIGPEARGVIGIDAHNTPRRDSLLGGIQNAGAGRLTAEGKTRCVEDRISNSPTARTSRNR